MKKDDMIMLIIVLIGIVVLVIAVLFQKEIPPQGTEISTQETKIPTQDTKIFTQENKTISPTNAPQVSTTNNKRQTKKMNTATITTNKGVINVKFFSNDAPKTVESFTTLAGKGFYNGTRFHRVIKGFMIQGGDPLSKDISIKSRWGTGGPDYRFDDEIDPASPLYKTGYKRGILAMANSGVNTNGSQFFIMHSDYPLPPSYTIFGQVTSGIEVVDSIAETPTVGAPTDRPINDIIIEKIEFK